MARKLKILCLAFVLSLLLSPALQHSAFAAAVETPKGKRIPGRILDEGDEEYKMETDLPGGGKIIFNIDKTKVDPHGTVPGAGRIEEINGTAEIKRVGRTYYSTARKGMPVHPGDEIRTGFQSKVVITLETTAISGVGANSEFVLENLEKNPDTKFVDIKVSLPKGELWSEVGRLKTKGSKFKVATPTAVTGVRGTVFHVEVEEGTEDTKISVLSGAVGVISSAIPAKEVVLSKSEALFVRRGKEPSRFDPTTLAERIAILVKEWTVESEFFKSATALAGIGQIEEIVIEPTLPEDQKQKVYDAIQAGWEKAAEDLFQIDKALKMFYLDFGRFPSLQEGGLNALITSTGTAQWNGPYAESQFLSDHYGVPYGYKVMSDIQGKKYAEITTFGYDKKPGTNDDRQKMVLEEDARRWQDRRNYR
jgi:hypothetical protein